MSVHYKFKSTLDHDTVSFDGLHISVADLKKAIFHQKRIGKNTDFDLQITNAQTKEDYTDDNALIAKNTSLIVARVPLTVQKKYNWDRTETLTFNTTKDETSIAKSLDLTRLDGSEEDKIRAMMTQSTQDYDPSNYMKIRGSNQTGEVPPNYRCYKCHQPGHWIKNCPLSTNQEPIEIKKSTGIPRSFMVPVEGPSVPGAMMTPGGTYAVPAIDHQAYKEGKKERPPFAQDPEPVVEKPEIPEDLLCNICKDLLTDAVMIPCCGNSFCDECIRTFLLESEDHECPDCNEKDVSPESLIPNRYLRNAVLNFKNETGYAKRPVYKPPLILPSISKLPFIAEPTISEKLSASPSMSAATPASGASASRNEAEAKEADKPIGKASPSYEKATTEPPIEADVATDSMTKLTGEEEAEVPPPPGTEPPLLPKHSDQSWHDHESSTENRDDEYGRYSRERRRSFSRDNHNNRNALYHNRMDTNMRLGSRRRSLSPRNSQHPDYSMHLTPGPKGYQSHMSGDNRYHQGPMHYDPNLRRSSDDRAGTPTVDEPHLHPPSHQSGMMPYSAPDDRGVLPTSGYNAPPQPGPPPAGLLPDPYMQGPRPPIYPPHQQPAPLPAGHGYPHPGALPPPAPRYPPPYQQTGYRPPGPPRAYSGPPRPMRGMHGRGFRSQIRSKWDLQVGYRGMQPPPPGMGRSMHNGTPGGIIDDPLEVFQRMLREKDERDRRMGKHRRRTRSRSRSPRSYSRSRSRSFGRRGSPSRASRSRSPPPKRRNTRSPPPSHRARSRTPKKSRRSRSGSFSISRSRSYSRSQSPRASLPRDRDRDRRGKKRDAPSYRSPARSPPRYHKNRDHDRERRRSREPYGSYYNDTAAPAPHDYGSSYRESRVDRAPRYPPASRGLPPTSSPLLPPPPGMIGPPTGPPVGVSSSVPPVVAPGQHPPSPLDRKDYFDYNRYPTAPNQSSRFKKFDDVAPPGTEGYYDLVPPGVDHVERSSLIKDRTSPKNKDTDRYKDDRDRHRDDLKSRSSRGDRRDRDYDYDKDHRHDRHNDRRSPDRKRNKRSSSPYTSAKYRDNKDSTPDRSRGKKDKDHEDSKSEDRKKEKKIKEKKKKRDSEDKEKKKKKKKEKKQALIQKEAAAAAAAAAAASAASAVVSSSTTTTLPIKVKVKEEPQSGDEAMINNKTETVAPKIAETVTAAAPLPEKVVVKTEPMDEMIIKINAAAAAAAAATTTTAVAVAASSEVKSSEEVQPPETKIGEKSPQRPVVEADSQAAEAEENIVPVTESLYAGLVDDSEITTTTMNSKINDDNNSDTTTTMMNMTTFSKEGKEEESDKTTVTSSPKKDEFLASIPELSKWERDESAEKLDDSANTPEKEPLELDDGKSGKIVTTEVLKRAENAIFQKAINAIRPIEIKKISDSRKILYQNPEPKIHEADIDSSRKSVNVTITVDKNQRNVELTSEPLKKTTKIERGKFKALQLSPTRVPVKERLGDKIEDEVKLASIKCVVEQRRVDTITSKAELTPKSGKSPRIPKDRRISMSIENAPIIPNPERKVFVEDRSKRDRSRVETRIAEETIRSHDRSEQRKNDRITRTPPQPPASFKSQRIREKEKEKDEEDDKDDRKRDKKLREDTIKKRKKDHRSRSKSRERRRRKDKKHKHERARSSDRRSQKKDKEIPSKEKTSTDNDKDKEKDKGVTTASTGNSAETIVVTAAGIKKQRKNPRLVSDRKRSLDEASFEPDYSASDSESDDDIATRVATKRAKIDDGVINVDAEKPIKKKVKAPSSSEDEDSSSTDSSSSDSDSSVESHRKKKRKHKKRKKRKSRRNDSSSDSDIYSDSSDSSSEEEKHRKKKKSKSKSKKSKNKKKSKHK